MTNKKYPKQWSAVVIYYRDGTSSTLNMSAGITIASHLMREMQECGFCAIRNDNECVVIAADMIERIEMRQLTQGEKT